MRVDSLTLALRPRSMSEAADWGAALVRAHARSVWGCFLPVYGVLLILVLPTAWFAGWLPMLLIFVLKPWLDRTLLFVLSRAAFGQSTRPADVWQAWRTLWFGQWFATLLSRFSPRRAYLLPTLQLEGLRGRALRQRRRLLLRHHRNAAFWQHTVFAHIEVALYIALLSVGAWVAPEGSREHFLIWLTNSDDWFAHMLATLAHASVVAVLEPFYVAGGFCMYLNRRVELEAWDVEQALRMAFSKREAL